MTKNWSDGIVWSEENKRLIAELIAEGWSREDAEIYASLTTDDVEGYKGVRAPERWWELPDKAWPEYPFKDKAKPKPQT